MGGVAFLLAPGAGQPSTSPWMTAWARRLAALGPVRAFDYPYQRAGRKRPDRLPTLIDAHREALAALREEWPDAAVVLAGKSMGSRVGCHLALEEPVAGLVCFGYPLVGQRGAVRDEVLLALERPVLFVQGTRDPLCPLDDLRAVLARRRAPHALQVVPTGDHSLQVTAAHRKATGRTQEDEDARVLDAVRAFVASLSPPPDPR